MKDDVEITIVHVEPSGIAVGARCLLGALLLQLVSTAASVAAPNIVVVMTDDQEDTGSMAYMPKTLSLIAEHGVTFKNSFVNLPLCAPSRASFLTGQAAHNHGIRTNRGGWESFKSKEENSLPVWLKAAGYKTALIGKYVNQYGEENTGEPRDWVPPGWDLWYSFTGSGVRYYDYLINENGRILSFGSASSDYSTDVLKKRAVQFIVDQSNANEPFFLFVAPKAAHKQGARAIPSPTHQQTYNDVRLPESPAFNRQDLHREAPNEPRWGNESKHELKLSYRAALQSLQSVDDLVAAVVEALEQTGMLVDTVIIYTSDNGFLFGDHRLIGKSAAYEGSIKVPLLMRGPDIPPNETRRQLVNNLDLVATIIDIAAAEPGVPLDGMSLRPLFADAESAWRNALLIESRVDQEKEDHYAGVRTATKKYVKYDDGFEQLFDLAADPNELKNQAEDSAYLNDLLALRRVQHMLKSCVGASCLVR